MSAWANAGSAIDRPSGFSFVELLFALGLLSTLSAIAVPQALAAIEDYRALGAVRYVMARLQDVRLDAITRGVDVGLRFVDNGGYTMTAYLDGNGTGVLSLDISAGADPRSVHPSGWRISSPASISD